MTTDLITQIDGPVARITINRPEVRNAINGKVIGAMRAFLGTVASDPAVRCVVLCGSGEHFSAGGDVKGFSQTLQQSPQQRSEEFAGKVNAISDFFTQLAQLPQPLVVKVRGAVAGAALGMVAASDFALCAAGAYFIAAQTLIGGSPDGAISYYLPRLIGPRRAKEMTLLGQRMTATEAAATGLVNRVVPDAELDAAVEELVARICAAPATSARRTKALVDHSLGNTMAQQFQMEAESFAACAATDDFVEGVSAFVEKRKAVFNRKR